MRFAKPVLLEDHPGHGAFSLRRPATTLGRLSSVVALVSGCGDDPPAPPPEPPQVAVEALEAIGGGRWSPQDDESLVLACEGNHLLVELGPGESADEIDEWVLRPPGTCGGEKRCGFVSLTLDPETDEATTVDAASTTVEMTLSGPGSHQLVVEFRKDDGSSPDVDGEPVTVEVNFSAVLPPDGECSNS
jgi:hypothetical protein